MRRRALRRRYGHSYNAMLRAEMAEILARHGYDPKMAAPLVREGMGAFELEHRILSTRPGEMGSLEYTHNIHKVRR